MKITPWNHYLSYVQRVLRDKPVAPVVQGQSKLCRPAFQFKLIPIEPEPEVRACHGQGRRIGFAVKRYLPDLSVVRRVDPVIDAKAETGDLSLRIVCKETRKQDFTRVRDEVTGCVFQI